ncbi:MAG: hypothetical protein AB7R55_18070 [Gemmatimonadales bacterium]
MTDGTAAIDREAIGLTRHLIGQPPSEYLTLCYRRAHAGAAGGEDQLDRLLIRAACGSRWLAAPADAYARLMRPAGGLRRRVTLLLAIAESAPDTRRHFVPAPGSWMGGVLGLGWDLFRGGLALGTGVILFGLPHLLGRLRPGRS